MNASWWQIEPGHPIRGTAMREQGNDQEIWVCGTCHALIVSPKKHIAWHEGLSEPKATKEERE